MDNAKIGKFIAEMRKNAGLSQTELAKELNISTAPCRNGKPATVCRI